MTKYILKINNFKYVSEIKTFHKREDALHALEVLQSLINYTFNPVVPDLDRIRMRNHLNDACNTFINLEVRPKVFIFTNERN